MSKQVFVSEKFISSAPVDTLCYVALMSKMLLLQVMPQSRGAMKNLQIFIHLSLNIPNSIKLYRIGLSKIGKRMK